MAPGSNRDRCDSQAVRAHLERILARPPVRSSPALRRLLRYMVEETLGGRGASLNEHSLAIAVFGRGNGFNRQSDSLVRVHVRNLRARLAQ